MAYLNTFLGLVFFINLEILIIASHGSEGQCIR